MTALRGFRNNLSDSVDMRLRLEAYEAKLGQLDDVPVDNYDAPMRASDDRSAATLR